MKRKIIYVDNFLTGHGHTPTTGTTLVGLFASEGYTVIPTSGKQNKLLRLADMLRTIYAHRKHSVVLIATYSNLAFYFACACAFLCRLLHVPYIPCLHGGNLPHRISRSFSLAQNLFRKSFTNVAVSGYLQQSLINNGWKHVVIPNNINLSKYPYMNNKQVNAAILWVRSFHEIYNPALAIHVVNELNKRGTPVRLTMIGPDKDGSLQACKQLVKQLKLEEQVTFTGLLPQHEWVKLAANYSIFLNTTNFDNAPVSVVEAMALGMAIITTNVGGIPYLVHDKVNALLVPPGEVMPIVDQVENLLKQPALVLAMARNARSKAEEFDWDNIKLLWSNLLGSVH